jgi:hypothetical protein
MGAYSAERMVSSRKLALTPMTPPAPRRMRFESSVRISQGLRYQQHDPAEPEKGHHEVDIESRPGGKELEIVAEILRPDQVRLHGCCARALTRMMALCPQ